MRTRSTKTKSFNKWAILAAILLAGLLCLFWWFLLQLFQPAPSTSAASTAIVTIFPFSTYTPTVDFSSLYTPTTLAETISTTDIAVGGYVQITGTGGVGLHVRAGPGTTYESKFIGMDSEVFKVEDGPQEADGFTWWYLVAPYDANRSGWAVANYLAVVVQ
jgi:hypothetical protein